MFCSKCGKQIPDDSLFCSACGTAINSTQTEEVQNIKEVAQNSAESNIERQMAIRKESIDELNRTIAYFGPKFDLYKEYDRLSKKLRKELKPINISSAFIIGIIMTLSSGVFLCVFFLSGFLIHSLNGVNNNSSNLFNIIIVSPFALGLFLCIFVHPMLKRNRNKKRAACIAELSRIESELTRHYKAFGPCIIGPEFSNPAILTQIRNLIQNGRADTPKEAINVLLDDAHKTRMQLQAELQTKALKSIKTSSAFSAGASIATAGFVGADFFGDRIGL